MMSIRERGCRPGEWNEGSLFSTNDESAENTQNTHAG